MEQTQDWTGSSRQRRDLGGCSVGAIVRIPVYIVPERVSVLVKRVGDPSSWRKHVTATVSEFRDPYRETKKSYIYQAAGWLMCVAKSDVIVKQRDGSDRFRTELKPVQ